MNQILVSKYNNKVKFNNIDKPIIKEISNKKKSSRKWFIILFIFSILIFISSFTYMAYALYKNYTKSNMYLNLFNDYDISKLYNSDNFANSVNTSLEEDIFSIIGIIKIDKIKISYPILSKIDDELLKIAPCKFSGPNINNVR